MQVQFQGVKVTQQTDGGWKAQLYKADHPDIKTDELVIERHNNDDKFTKITTTYTGKSDRIAKELSQPYTDGKLSDATFMATLKDILGKRDYKCTGGQHQSTCYVPRSQAYSDNTSPLSVEKSTQRMGNVTDEVAFRIENHEGAFNISEDEEFLQKKTWLGGIKTRYNDETLGVTLDGDINGIVERVTEARKKAAFEAQMAPLLTLLGTVPTVNKFLERLRVIANENDMPGLTQNQINTELFAHPNRKQVLKELKIMTHKLEKSPGLKGLFNPAMLEGLKEATGELERDLQKNPPHPTRK